MGLSFGRKVGMEGFDLDLECKLKKLEDDHFELTGLFRLGPFYRPAMHGGLLQRLLRREVKPCRSNTTVLFIDGPGGCLYSDEFMGNDKVYGSAYSITVNGKLGNVHVHVRGTGNYEETGKLVLKAVEKAIKEYKGSQDAYDFAV